MANVPKIKEHKKILLEDVPKDVQTIMIRRLKDECENCRCQRNQNYALYKIVREWDSVFSNEDHPSIVISGQYLQLEDIGIEFTGTDIIITSRIPITSKVGAILNHARIQAKR